jgi:hypothetical protein
LADLRFETGCPDHPKIARLVKLAGAEGFRCLTRLWAWVATNRPSSGDLKGFDDDDIEDLARWNGVRGVLVNALRELRLLDGGARKSRIHDWKEHQPWLAHAVERKEHASKAAAARWANKYSSALSGGDTGGEATIPGASNEDASGSAPTPIPDPDRKPDQTSEGEEASRASCPRAASGLRDFTLDESLRSFAREMGCDPDSELEAFRDYCSGTEKKYANYPAAFRGWIRKTGDFGRAPVRAAAELKHRGCTHRGCAHLPDFACKYVNDVS